jgi:hypothetical protein
VVDATREDIQRRTQDYVTCLGKLVMSLQTLEVAIRVFLGGQPGARPWGWKYGTSVYSCGAGTELDESDFTSYDSLPRLIGRYNEVARPQGLPELGKEVVEVRDALAHGRLLGHGPGAVLRLIKFSRPQKNGRVRVEFNEEPTLAWFVARHAEVKRAYDAVLKSLPASVQGEP